MRQVSANGRGKKGDPVATLSGDVAAIKRDISHLIGLGAGNVSAKARETASRLGEDARHIAQQAREQYDSAHETLAETTGKRPVATILVSVAAGMIIGKVLGWAMSRSED